MKLAALLSTYKLPHADPVVFLTPSDVLTSTSILIYALYGSQNPLSLILNLIMSLELTPIELVLKAIGVNFYYLMCDGKPVGLISL